MVNIACDLLDSMLSWWLPTCGTHRDSTRFGNHVDNCTAVPDYMAVHPVRVQLFLLHPEFMLKTVALLDAPHSFKTQLLMVCWMSCHGA
jgi:hypothetical protein